MKPIITMLCAVLIALSGQVSGQNMSTSFVVSPSSGPGPYPVGTQVKIDFRVNNFTKIVSVLYPIKYNNTLLRFDSITNPVLPGYTDLLPSSHPTAGVIKIIWFPSPLDFPDGYTIAGSNVTLMSIWFTVLADGVSSVNMATNIPNTPIEVINSAGNEVFNNSIFNSGGSSTNGASVTGGAGAPPPPPLSGFKIIATDVHAKQGNRVCVPVSVNDFDNIQLLQFAMHWDPTKLAYECVRGATSPLVPTFNAPAAAPGTLLLQWEDPNLLAGTGVTRADGSRVFEVCFNATGAPGTESPITIDGFGFGFPPDFTAQFAEAANSAGNNLWVNGSTGVPAKVYIQPEPPVATAVTFTADQDTVGPNMNTCIDVKVKNFTTITEAEFAITYDATKLTFVTPVTIPATSLNLAAANFTHAVNAGTGTLKFKWANNAGVTIADNTAIFSVCFTAVGASGSVVPVSFATTACPNPTPFAVMKKTTTIAGTTFSFNSGSVTIKAQNGPPTLAGTSPLCNGAATGSVANTTNGTATAYTWSNGATTQNLAAVAAGTYTVTITYGSSGTSTASVTLSAPPAITISQTATQVSCFGGNNGAIDITPNGGTAPYVYAWAGPMMFSQNTQDVSSLKTGNYVVTVTDANQCQFTSSPINVGQPTPMNIPNNNIVITSLSCFGGSNAAITINPTGGTTPYTFLWSNNATTQNLSNLSAGTYNLTITDSRSCTYVYPNGFTISNPPQMTVSVGTKTDVKCFGSATGTATITVNGGTGNKNYSWRRVSDNVQVSPDQNPTNLPAGTFNVIVTDAAGCTATLPNPVVIADAPSALNVTHTSTPGLCFGQSTGSIDLTVMGGWGSYTYDWPGSLQDNIQDQPAVSSGTYVVTVSDNMGCTATRSVMVGGAQTAIQSGNPTVTPVLCFGQTNGSICINPTGGNGAPYTVAWSGTSSGTGNCLLNVGVGSYSATITDAQMCTSTVAAVSVTGPSAALSLTPPSPIVANPVADLDITVSGGTSPYVYAWSNQETTQDLTGVGPATYGVTVNDANGCSVTGLYTVDAANVLNSATAVGSPACSDDGKITVNIPQSASVASPFKIKWCNGLICDSTSTSSLTYVIDGINAGVYSVIITASNNNTITINTQVVQNPPAQLSLITLVQPYDDFQNGSISLTPASNCTIQWWNGSTSNFLNNLDSGLYVVTIRNNLPGGCTDTVHIRLFRQYQNFVAQVTQEIDPSCGGQNNGSISIAVSGGDGPDYTYQWSGPNGFTNESQNISNLSPGNYFVTVSDARDSVRILGPIVLATPTTVDITNVNELSITPGGTQVSGAEDCDGVASLVYTGGVGNVTIEWNNGVTTPVNSTLCGGEYSVTVTDSQGCTDVWTGELTAPPALALTSNALSPKCFGLSNGSAKVFVSGGVEPYQVLWPNNQYDQFVFASTFSQAIGLDGGDYKVTITDANSVQKVFNVNVPEPQPFVVEFATVDPTEAGMCDGERIITVNGATAPVSYTWVSSRSRQNGDTERATDLCAGDIVTYIIQDANGCSLTVYDTVPYPPDACFDVRPVLTPGEQDGNNDFVYITCIEGTDHTIEIYNRWGQLVFQTDSYSNNIADPLTTFTGFTRTGLALAEGVYYYVLTVVDSTGERRQIKGHINLIK